MIVKQLYILLIICLTIGCSIKDNPSTEIYNRTKDIRFNGQVSVSKGETMLSVTWKYAKQIIVHSNNGPAEELQDCFRSEIIFDGKTEAAVLFSINNYLCGTHTPLNTESLTFEEKLPARITFHSMELKILTADNSKLVFESQ